ncbi:sugar transferase [Bizionia gelidisalsuginis]|uniref:Sugar transferase n=1 Tax=Bizionia gelidisalsuginis TaxID=291188 RepID=A0ABY3M7E1_9FLAO|nr:sugar transferase [Bizionia gelidisalsuginis]TYC08813.1 sugar transferase [Bizionia gelidisalsuginis]
MTQTVSYRFYALLKRVFDFFLSIAGFLIIVPLFLVVMIILKLTGEGEIFYLQERLGLNKTRFYIYKFASMLKASSNIGNKGLTVRNDPRITKAGKLLRITKINELPQILNVIKGNMALVGPRPLLAKGFQNYTPEVQAVIYKNRPGITGIGSLIFRDEELLVTTYKALGKNPLEYYKTHIYPYKGALEYWYFYNCSLLVDFKILFLTFWSLVNSDSQLVYKAFKNLPPKPESLTVAGIHKL